MLRYVLLIFAVLVISVRGTEWHRYLVDTLTSGTYGAAIDLDSLGYPHIVFDEYYDRGLVYAWMNSDSTWGMEAIGLDGSFPSMEMDREGCVHVAFESCGLAYGMRDSVWHVIYPSPGWGGKYPSLALDRDGEPHIVSTMGYGYDALVVYTYREGGEWHVEVVDTVSECGHLSIVLDDTGRPHVVYSRLGRGFYVYRPGFRHAVRVGEGEWRVEEVDTSEPGAVVVINPVAAIDSLGRIWVVYEMIDSTGTGYNRVLKYAWSEGNGKWYTGSIENISTAASGTDLEVDRDWNLHLTYKYGGVLKYGWWGGGEWHVEVVDTVDGQISTWDDMEVGVNGAVHIAYCNSYHTYPHEGLLMYCWGKPEVGVGEGGRGLDCEGLLKVEPVVSSGMVEVIMELRSERYIELDLYDVSGRRVRELWRGDVARGEHRMEWDGRDSEGRLLSSGVYFLRLEGMGRRAVRKVVLVR